MIKTTNIGPITPMNSPIASFKKICHHIESHWHSFYELEFVISGKGKHIINDVEYPVETGLFQLITPSDVHEYRLEKPLEIFTIQFPLSSLSGNIVQSILTLKQISTATILNNEEYDLAYILCSKIINENFEDVYGEDFFTSVLTLLLTLLFRKSRHINAFKNVNISREINKIILFLQENFNKQISSREISEAFFMSHGYFMRYFKSQTGVSLADYLKKLRMQHAKKLIKNSSLSVLAISLECGYRSVTTFLRDFKKEHNLTPTQMRKNLSIDKNNKSIDLS